MKKTILIVAMLLLSRTVILSSDTLRIGVYNNPPLIECHEDNRYSGIFYDVLTEVCAQENITPEFIQKTWSELFSDVTNGTIDALVDVTYSDKRATYLTFSTIPLLDTWLEVYTRSSQPITDLNDLRHKSVAILKSSIQHSYIENVLNNELHMDITIQAFNTTHEVHKALLDGTADALVASRFFQYLPQINRGIINSHIVFMPQGLHFAFKKNINPNIVEKFDRVLKIIKNDQNSMYYKSLKTHLKNSQSTKHTTLFITSLAIISSIILIFTINIFQKRKIRLQLLELQKKNEELLNLNTLLNQRNINAHMDQHEHEND